MRGYFFGNMYLSSIQQGIQTKHCGDEMVVKYAPDPSTTNPTAIGGKYDILYEYLKSHKTVICLNAGYSSTLHNIFDAFEDTDNPYPYAKFHESEEALDAALTCVGIILPEEIYETASEVRCSRGRDGRANVDNLNQYGEWPSKFAGTVLTFTKWQVWLINELNNYRLAS